MDNLPKSIDEVIEELDKIINDAVEKNNYNAIFAYVYKRTTIEIKLSIENAHFKDNEGMEIFDVYFANLYIKAYRDYNNGLPISNCWQKTFEVGKQKLTYMQHLLLGMNAHINFDLGLTAAHHAKGKIIDDIQEDFMKVNEVLFLLTEEMQSRLSRVSPLLFLLDIFGGKKDEKFANFGIKVSRGLAWVFAKSLSEKPLEKQPFLKEMNDKKIANIAAVISNPRLITLKIALWCIRKFENKSLAEVLQKLKY